MACPKWEVMVDIRVMKWVRRKRPHRLRKLRAILKNLERDPYSTGKRLEECRRLWSTRIDRRTRLLYTIDPRQCKVRVLGVGSRDWIYKAFC